MAFCGPKTETKTLLCNRPSSIYILSGFLEKTSLGQQILNQVAPFCQVAVLP